MEHEEPEVKSVPFPDARTAYQLRRMKDKVIGTAVDWEIVQREYWPVIEIMEDLDKANDRNGAFILWLLKQVPGDDVESMRYRNEVHRRIGVAFLDPDGKKNLWHTDVSYFQDQEGSPVVKARDVVEREIQWLWPGRIPLGKHATLAGPGGVGKSFLLCDMAARVSAGLEWPFSEAERAPVGNVLIISGEDEIEDTIRPRLRLQGADLDRVYFPSPSELLGFNLSGPKFKEVADRMLKAMDGASLLIIDPPSSFLAGIDENSNAEVRGMLTPMKIWAHENNCAVIFNTHINKGAGKKLEIQQRVIGSVAMVNGPRMSHMVTVSEDDHEVKLFVPLKSNIWQRLKALSFRIVPDLHELSHARLEWIGEVDIDAGDAVNGRDEESKRITNALVAERWLIEKFRSKSIWQSRELLEWAEEELGEDQKTAIKNAKNKLGIQSKKIGPNWVCWVSDDWQYGK